MKTKSLYSIIKAIVVFIFLSIIISDWANFKAGITGKIPVNEQAAKTEK